jgi:hypothetical protein
VTSSLYQTKEILVASLVDMIYFCSLFADLLDSMFAYKVHMESIASLDVQLQHLTSLSKANARLLDSITDVAASIQLRSNRIRLDVVPWGTSQDQITETIEESFKAARSYQTPPFVPQVLNRRVKDPVLICRAIDHLVYANEYLSSKPSNDYGDKLAETMSEKLKQIVVVSNEVIQGAFVQSTGRMGAFNGMTSKDFRTPAKPGRGIIASHSGQPLIFHSKLPLKDIDSLVQNVYESFDSLETVHVAVRELLAEKMSAVLMELFDGPYLEESEAAARDQSASHANLAALVKHYQPGGHKLLGHSASCRSMVKEVAEVVSEYILVPTNDDYNVTTMPAELAQPIFDHVMQRAEAAVQHDLPADATVMFIESRGAGIGLHPSGRSSVNRHFRDCIFVGLDAIAELWRWIEVSDGLPGDAGDFQDHVREKLSEFLDTIRQCLMTYRDAKGQIRAKKLVSAATESVNKEWMPAVDCTVHESTTNMLHLLRVLFTSYFGAAKLALHGPGETADDDTAAREELEDFVQACVEGTIEDLVAIGKASLVLSNMQDNSHRYRATNAAVKSLGGTAKERVRIDLDIFIINNASFLLEHLKKEPCFTSKVRKEPLDDAPPPPKRTERGSGSDDSSDEDALPPPPQFKEVPIMSDVLQHLEDIREEHVEAYCESWATMFPSIDEDTLREVADARHDEASVLTKEQRMAVKKWYGEVADRLERRLMHGSVHVVMDGAIRSALIDGASRHVLEGFEKMEDMLDGRDWSTQPLKWSKRDAAHWVDEMQKLF